jgi:hypothetical protein
MVMPPPVPVISQTSRKIYEERKENAFKQIFLHLAHSEDKVCWDRLDFKEVDCAIMPILFPLLEEIQIMQIELNQSDFSTALNYLFGTLNPEEKNIILTFSSERQPSVEHSPLVSMIWVSLLWTGRARRSYAAPIEREWGFTTTVNWEGCRGRNSCNLDELREKGSRWRSALSSLGSRGNLCIFEVE